MHEPPEHSDRVDALRRQLAVYLDIESKGHQYTPDEISIAVTQLLAGISIALPGELIDNIRWVVENYTMAISQMNSEIGVSAEVGELTRGGDA